MKNKRTRISLPSVVFGTSGLGNLFVTLEEEEKLDIVRECVAVSKGKVVFDSAGKYGAGLALEVLGNCLRQLKVHPDNVVISNKLAWLRTELKTEEPLFEPGVWKNLKYDAIQRISYDGIMECFEQGNELLNGYVAQMLSVHDPDEYLILAEDKEEEGKRYMDILDGYNALFDLKQKGKVESIGVGAKDWRIVKKIAGDVPLDWIMIANSMTVKYHPEELIDFIVDMESKGVHVINSAVFHSGFLVGSNYFDYRPVQKGTAKGDGLYLWRKEFFKVCDEFDIKPAHACIQFGLNVPGVKSIALNTTDVERVKENLDMSAIELPFEFWEALKTKKLIKVNPFGSLQMMADKKETNTNKK